MAAATQSAHPIQTLRDSVTALEAAILACLDDPGKKPVHRLRTFTRRIEAQLELLEYLDKCSPLPAHSREARKARKLLKKLRRAAGRVRDMDVQRDLISAEISSGLSKSSGVSGSKGDPAAKTRAEFRRLRRSLKQQRDVASADLIQLLEQRRGDFTSRFEALLEALAPAESLTMTSAQLSRDILGWFHQAGSGDSTGHAQTIQPDSEDAGYLHNIRKRAKLARYLAESAPETASRARRLAARFEDLQESGGIWHDREMLAKLASKRLSHAAALQGRLREQAADALQLYRQELHNIPA